MPITPNQTPRTEGLDKLAKLMDSQFKIPGTSIRIGLDALLGLIPGIGDISTLLVSLYILLMLAQKGASGFLLARMLLNIIIDSVLGAIPLIGDLFDIGFKANQRNLKLMHEHHVEGRHKGSAMKLIIPLLLLFIMLSAAILWLIYKGIYILVDLIF